MWHSQKEKCDMLTEIDNLTGFQGYEYLASQYPDLVIETAK